MYLLDGVGAAFFIIAFGLGLLFIILAIFLEAWVMVKMKYHVVYGKAALHSMIANLLTLAAGFLFFANTSFFSENNIAGTALLFVFTVVLEGLTLFFLNKDKPVKNTLLTTLVMNLITYAIAFITLELITH